MNRRTLHGIGSSAILLAVLAGCERDDPNSVLLLGTLEREAITLTSPVTEQLVERPVGEGIGRQEGCPGGAHRRQPLAGRAGHL